MKISSDEFDSRLQANELRLALVGMSNSGKSTCTNLLAREMGFAFLEVDESINRELKIETMEQAAEWMGYPFEPDYPINKQRYLDLEEELTRIDVPSGANFVLDTTGSIIYGSVNLRNWIQSNFLVIGLEVTENLCQVLINDYFDRPKTVIWGSEFQQLDGEDGIEAMKRCYPILLKNRSKLYAEMSNVGISAELARDPSLNSQQLLNAIRDQL